MGTAFQAWVVDLERVRGLCASRDEALLARLSTFLSVPDARTYLSQPYGRCVIIEVAAGRW